MQYTEIFFSVVKIEFFYWKLFDRFNILAQNRDGSKEYPHSMFWINKYYKKNRFTPAKNKCYKKNRFTPANPSFTLKMWGVRRYSEHRHVFMMAFSKYRLIFFMLSTCYSVKIYLQLLLIICHNSIVSIEMYILL